MNEGRVRFGSAFLLKVKKENNERVGASRMRGSLYKLSKEHYPACFEELCSRFKDQEGGYQFRGSILGRIGTPNLEYKAPPAAEVG